MARRYRLVTDLVRPLSGLNELGSTLVLTIPTFATSGTVNGLEFNDGKLKLAKFSGEIGLVLGRLEFHNDPATTIHETSLGVDVFQKNDLRPHLEFESFRCLAVL